MEKGKVSAGIASYLTRKGGIGMHFLTGTILEERVYYSKGNRLSFYYFYLGEQSGSPPASGKGRQEDDCHWVIYERGDYRGGERERIRRLQDVGNRFLREKERRGGDFFQKDPSGDAFGFLQTSAQSLSGLRVVQIPKRVPEPPQMPLI